MSTAFRKVPHGPGFRQPPLWGSLRTALGLALAAGADQHARRLIELPSGPLRPAPASVAQEGAGRAGTEVASELRAAVGAALTEQFAELRRELASELTSRLEQSHQELSSRLSQSNQELIAGLEQALRVHRQQQSRKATTDRAAVMAEMARMLAATRGEVQERLDAMTDGILEATRMAAPSLLAAIDERLAVVSAKLRNPISRLQRELSTTKQTVMSLCGEIERAGLEVSPASGTSDLDRDIQAIVEGAHLNGR